MNTLLLKLHAQTSIHAGSGQADSVIDLPVQRESHTGYPCVFGSSMKGALRTHAERRVPFESAEEREDTVNKLFGKEGDGDNGNAGAVLVSDARLLLLPMRSLTGQFRWVTCPNILNRLVQDSKRFGMEITAKVPAISSGEVLTLSGEDNLYLEEYRFNKSDEADAQLDSAWVTELASYIAYEDGEKLLEKQLAVVSNDDFAYLAQYALPVNPHIAINSETKITKTGALWYEETLPSDSVLYVGIAVEDERKKKEDRTTDKTGLAKAFKQLFTDSEWLQVGGNETVGMGWCSVETTDIKEG